MILDQFLLNGKTALVTGCKRGIGKAIAVALAEAGADIIGVSSTLECTGSKIQEDIQSRGRNFRGYKCDFSDREDLYSFIKKIKNDVPVIDILINNVGTIYRKRAIDYPDEYWDKIIEINLNSQFILTREIAKGMIERRRGKIVFIASVLTFTGGIFVPSYAASKGGIGQLTRALSNEWASKGLNINAIAPGYIETDSTAPVRDDPKRYNDILKRIPAGRWGLVEDMAGAALLLSSAASDYMNGSIIIIDGGWMGR